MFHFSKLAASILAVSMSFVCVFLTPPHKINTIPGAMMNSQFADAFPDGFDVTRVTKRQPINPRCNPGSDAVVTKFRHPVRKSGSFTDLNHRRVYPVGYKLSSLNWYRRSIGS